MATSGSPAEADMSHLLTADAGSRRLVVLVNGLPAAGKTTLARALSRRLSLPLFSKDVIKEAHAGIFGAQPPDGRPRRAWNSQFGAAANDTMWALLHNFNNFLLVILYLFVPWTAVNLVDYYIVRRGHYAIAEIFNPAGIYGRWGWRGILAYLIGFGAMVPFFNVGSLFEGAAAKALGGADISFFVGLPIAGVIYFLLTRSLDVEAERRVADAEAAALEPTA